MYGLYHTFMSRGLGRLQAAILALLNGSARTRVFVAGGREFTTDELLEELEEAGVLKSAGNRKAAMFAIRRACRGLEERGLADRTEVSTGKAPYFAASWKLARKEEKRK